MRNKNDEGIIIDFDFVSGRVDVEAVGFEGNACSIDVNDLMKTLGAEINKRKMKRPTKDQNVHRVQRS